MPPVNAQTDSVVFQQIDIDQYTSENNKPMLRLFGVTKASLKLCLGNIF